MKLEIEQLVLSTLANLQRNAKLHAPRIGRRFVGIANKRKNCFMFYRTFPRFVPCEVRGDARISSGTS